MIKPSLARLSFHHLNNIVSRPLLQGAHSIVVSWIRFDNFVTGQLARHGLGEDKLVLVGFSQGTMMSLFTAPRREKQIAGIVGYSGRMESPDTLKAEVRSKPPVVMVHGDSDELLAVSEMETAAATLRDCGIDIETHVRPGLGHGIDEEGIRVGRHAAANDRRTAGGCGHLSTP